MKKIRNSIIRFFGLKGSFQWAVKQMKAGKIVKRRSTAGAVKYRLSTDEQNRLQWDFHRKENDAQWENAYFFVSCMEATDYFVFEWEL